MKPNAILGLTVGITVVAVAAIWLAMQESARTQPDRDPSKPSDYKAKLEKVKTRMAAMEGARIQGDEDVLAQARLELVAAVGGRAGRMLEMAMGRNAPITMYGKVVDQYGQPVAGARVSMVIAGGGTYAPGTGLTAYTTDSDGMFHIEAKGQEISISDVDHPQVAQLMYETRGGYRRTGAQRLKAISSHGEEFSWQSYSSPEKPYLVHVWRVSEFEDVKKGGTAFIPEPNGEPDKRAGIVVTCRREPMEKNKHWREQKGGWSVTFEPIEGGIQQTDDLYLNEAPSDGYKRKITVSMKRTDPDYRVRIVPARRYYYTAHNGEWYGSFSASFEPYMLKDKCLVNADIKYNPNGSRNLAMKPRR